MNSLSMTKPLLLQKRTSVCRKNKQPSTQKTGSTTTSGIFIVLTKNMKRHYLLQKIIRI
jgi:hypothetical protein